MNFHPWFNGLLHPLSVPAVSPPLLRSHPADCSPGSSNLLPGFRYIYLLKKERNKLLITCACSSTGAGVFRNRNSLLDWYVAFYDNLFSIEGNVDLLIYSFFTTAPISSQPTHFNRELKPISLFFLHHIRKTLKLQ